MRAVAVKNSQEAKRAPRHAPGSTRNAASSSKRGFIDAHIEQRARDSRKPCLRFNLSRSHGFATVDRACEPGFDNAVSARVRSPRRKLGSRLVAGLPSYEIRVALLSFGVSTARDRSVCRGGRRPLWHWSSAARKYPDPKPRSRPINDARDIADELKRDGFNVDIGENLTGDRCAAPSTSSMERSSRLGRAGVLQRFRRPVQPPELYDPDRAQIWDRTDVRRDGSSLETVLGRNQQPLARRQIP